ncbi:MAG: UDP-N-acetylglucosamine 1-carboxyvinyltransferase, partial [Candidatus Glassbacteria bacterium]|nr:UDP-N-acetylglucosamine 1-carboxyvinyltransferase [Candidatus Glassbacteria bacterium]
MDKFIIEKSGPLAGEVQASGAKNACLPLMAASLLTDRPLVLENVPDLMDVRTMAKVLENLGVRVAREPGRIMLDAARISGFRAPYD